MNKRFTSIAIIGILLFCTLLGVSGQTIASEDRQAVRMAIEKIYAVYIKAAETFDADLWLTNWDENGVKMVANAAPLVGKSAIAAFARSKFTLFSFRKMIITIDKIETSGNLAIAQGTYTSEDQLKTASAPTLSLGWYCTTFLRQADGSWKILTDSVGSIPLPSPAAVKTINIFTAAKSGTAEQIEAAIKSGAKLEDRDEENSATPLMIAAGWNPDPKVITVLLNAGAKINERDKYNNKTPLMFAAMYSTNPEIVLTLLKAGADGRLLSFKGLTAFDYADRNPALKGTQAWLALSNAKN